MTHSLGTDKTLKYDKRIFELLFHQEKIVVQCISVSSEVQSVKQSMCKTEEENLG
jgi:hypothetical protein